MGEGECSPLLPKHQYGGGERKSTWNEFVDLSGMAFQVSLSTVARIALTSIDSIFLGHIGVPELAAASLAQVWTSAPLMAVWASASALITLCGQSWGAGNAELTGVWLQFGLLLTTVLSIPVFIWYWCIGYVLEYSTDDPQVIALATTFSRVLAFSILPSLAYACLRQYFQAIGIIYPTTLVGAMSIIVAICGNYVFIYGIGSWQGLGFVGSPLSTVFASWFQPIALFSFNFLYKKYHRRAWGGWNWKALTLCRLRAFITIAGPIAGNSFASNLANALISLVAARLGPQTIAANAVISGLWGLLWALFWGYGCATQVRVANYLGAGQPARAKAIAKLGLLCTVCVVSALAVCTAMFDWQLIAVYTNDAELMRVCRGVLPIFICAYVVESIEMLFGGVLTGMGQVKVIFWASTLTTWCVNLTVAYIGGITMGYGLPALWIGVLSMEVLKLLTYVVALQRTDWQRMADRAMEAMEAAPESTQAEVEKGAVNYITAVVGSQPTGYIASMPETTTPPLSTPYMRQKRVCIYKIAVLSAHVREQYVYQDDEERLHADAKVLGMRVVTKDQQLDSIVKKTGSKTSTELQQILQWSSIRNKPVAVSEANNLIAKVEKAISRAQKKRKLAKDEADEARSMIKQKISQSVGVRNENLALRSYERSTGNAVRMTNKELYVIAYPMILQHDTEQHTEVDYVAMDGKARRWTIPLGRAAAAQDDAPDEVIDLTSEATSSSDTYFSICGMIDGVTDSLRILEDDEWEMVPLVVEVKNRLRAFRNPPPLHDHIQMAVYMKMLGVDEGDMIQCMHDDKARIQVSRLSMHSYPLSAAVRNDQSGGDVWTTIVLPRLHHYVTVIQYFRDNDLARLSFLDGTPQERIAMLRSRIAINCTMLDVCLNAQKATIMAGHRQEVLRLYRSILTLHKKKLPAHMRVLGDQYVRDEFRRHKEAPQKYVAPFMREWQQYEKLMQQKTSNFGRELSADDRALLDAQQQDKLKSLKQAAKLVGESMP
ncbi:TPA: hypothetical protein N0F65_011569 [Lagenidium giganteum]|uniref:Multidrug and toxic compound extrusion protein n=1 Tax=Lagenidium giganteum TaxID=4803 RepID=A0AAV2YN39_9STRA|nr:TPA: hypothetical protein N0F65_011569 [Lagenidium giganteum]